MTLGTVLAGWVGGVTALAVGQPLAWFLVLAPRFSLSIEPGSAGSLVAATMSQLSIIIAIALYQREIQRAWAARDEVERTKDNVVREINHRVKNTLAVVQAIARSTFGDEGREAVRAFSGRLKALAAAHDILMESHWQDASFAKVVHDALRPFRRPGDPFVLEGEDFPLPPRAAINLALALHELATNAVKYGALGTAEGVVNLRWSATPEGAFDIVWEERGGPPVNSPANRGFGTNLIARGIAAEIGGNVTLDFRLAGLVCTIRGRLSSDRRAS